MGGAGPRMKRCKRGGNGGGGGGGGREAWPMEIN
jgi:hypothetical protein